MGQSDDVITLRDFGIQLFFGNTGGTFISKPSYSYKITFTDNPTEEVLETNTRVNKTVAGYAVAPSVDPNAKVCKFELTISLKQSTS